MHRRWPITLSVLLLCGCGTDVPGEQLDLSGHYLLQADGADVSLNLIESNGSIQGTGRIGDETFVLAATRSVVARGTVLRSDGSAVPVEITQSNSSAGPGVAGVQISAGGFGRLALNRSEEVATPATGAFSGRYRAIRDSATIAELNLTQSGNLVTGGASILGDAVSVTGTVTGDDALVGFGLYADGTRVRLSARRIEAGLLVSGLGGEQRLERR